MSFALDAGAGPRAHRRERRRQEHADEHPRRRAAARRGRRCELAGAPYRPASPHDASQRGIALIHQELSLCPHLTVAENILLGPRAVALGRLPAHARPSGSRSTSSRASRIRTCGRTGWSATLPLAAQQVVEICRAIAVARADRADGRADQQPAARRRRAPVRADPAAARRGARRSSTSATSSRRCARSPMSSPCCATAAASRTAPLGGDHQRRSSSRTWSAAPVDQLFPERARHARRATSCSTCATWRRRRSSGRRTLHAAARRDPRHRRPDGIGTHRDGARAVRPRAGGVAAPCASQAPTRRSDAIAVARASRQRVGYLSEDRKGEGLALPMSVADNLTLHRLRVVRAARLAATCRSSAAQTRRWIGDLGIKAHEPGPARRGRCRAATSRRSRWAGCCTRTPTSCCSTSRRAASTSAARRRSTRSIAAGRAQRQGGADGQLVPARAVRPVRSARRDEPRPAVAGATDREWTPERVLHAAIDAEASVRMTVDRLQLGRIRSRADQRRPAHAGSRGSGRSSACSRSSPSSRC